MNTQTIEKAVDNTARSGEAQLRTRRLLEGSIPRTLLVMAIPNILVMMAQASTGLIETWWLSRLGEDALAGIALVFPGYMMMTMLSAGAVGGGISSAIARALGRADLAGAQRLVAHALAVSVVLGGLTSIAFLTGGRLLYHTMGGSGGALEAALAYSNVVFAGNVMLWVMNALASVIRGTGNMAVPSIAICSGVALLLPLSPVLIFGLGPIPAMGVAGGGVAVVLSTAVSTFVLVWHLLSGRSVLNLSLSRLRWQPVAEILHVGSVGIVQSLQITGTIAGITMLVGRVAGQGGVAGYGTSARLESFLLLVVFGFGAPLVAMVGTNIGAGQAHRAKLVALTGSVLSFAVTETVGLAVAAWPKAWLRLFSADPSMIEAGTAYLRTVAPSYGFFGLGMALYFAAQGARRLRWPLLVGVARAILSVTGVWLVLSLGGTLTEAFLTVAAAFVLYGCILFLMVARGMLDQS